MNAMRIAAAVLSSVALVAVAEEPPAPTPTPTASAEQPQATPTPTQAPQRLGGGLGGGSMGRAQRPERTGTPVVLDNAAVKELAKDGAVTIAPNRPVSAPAEATPDPNASDEAIIAEWAAAKARVASAEANIERFERIVAEDKENRWWRGEGATEPGITKPPVVVKREEMQAELAAAQKALAAAEGRVAAAGLDLAKLEERLVLTPQ
jgi:hypothetical protein